MLGPEQLLPMLRRCSDLLLVVDRAGVLLAVEHQDLQGHEVNFTENVGQSLFDTMTVESRLKIASLLEHLDTEPSRWRQINYPVSGNADVPMRFCACAMDAERVRLAGQNMHEIAETQQLLMKTQQALENDFAHASQIRTRYRLLMDLCADAILNIDARSRKITSANPAAQRLLGRYLAPIKNHQFPSGFDTDSTATLEELLQQALSTGRADDVAVRTADQNHAFLASASLMRDRSESALMVRLTPLSGVDDDPVRQLRVFETLLANSPDAVALCEASGEIVAANETLAQLTQAPSASQLVGRPIGNWLGRSARDYRLLIDNLKKNGVVSKFSSVVRSDQDVDTEVEISAASVSDSRFPYTLLIIRNIQSRLHGRLPGGDELVATGSTLKDLVGRVPLKELVRESTDMIEKMCIESALEISRDNRASAAEMLGLSRQSLYTKLRRFGIADTPASSD